MNDSRPHRVFISYGSQDMQIAVDVCAALEEHGISCWIAPRDVVAGVPYAESIVDAIDAAELMVLVLTPAANGSRHVLNEVDRAVGNGLALLPVSVGQFEIAKALLFYISSQHRLQLSRSDLESSLPGIVDAAKGLLKEGTSRPIPGSIPASTTQVPEPAVARLPGLAVRSLASLISICLIATTGWFLLRNADESTGRAEAPPQAATVRVVVADYTGDGTDDLLIDNGLMWLSISADDAGFNRDEHLKEFVTRGGPSGKEGFLREPIVVRGMVYAEEKFWTLQTLESEVSLVDGGPSEATYEVTSKDAGGPVLLERTIRVTLRVGEPAALVAYEWRNVGDTSCVFKHPPSHKHEGQPLGSVAPKSLTDVEVYLRGTGDIGLTALNWWRVDAPDRIEPVVVVFEPRGKHAATFGLLPPQAARVHQLISYYTGVTRALRPLVEFTIREFELAPGQQFRAHAVLAFHTGGVKEGLEIYRADRDGDGVHDMLDNCPDHSNPGQEFTGGNSEENDCCASDCAGRECGDNGCGASCGTCRPDEICNERFGVCLAPSS
jgi:hypothetical protein